MLVVAAAGNDGLVGNPLSYPASLPHVLTVAATDEQNRVSIFSSQSRFVDLAAPGENITVATALDDSWAAEAGTSFSSPLVAGAAAWVWTVRPELDASQLFEVMRRSAVDIAAPGRDDATGFGLLNVPAALAYAAPVPDPLEPNDDVDYVTPGQDVRQRHPAADDEGEAVHDAHRPAHDRRGSAGRLSRLRSRSTARSRSRRRPPPATASALWGPATQTVREVTPNSDRVAHGITSKGAVNLTYKNPGRATTLYLAVTLATQRRATRPTRSPSPPADP